jgi:biopolymer transport protein ExbD
MAFASFDKQRGPAPLAEINMVPLIDVLLVLLVIFIVTAPLLSHSVKLDLPRADASVIPAPAEKINFSINAQGQRFWNGEALSREQAAARFKQAGQTVPTPEVQLRADTQTAYGLVAQTLADASRAGLHKVGFVSQPEVP